MTSYTLRPILATLSILLVISGCTHDQLTANSLANRYRQFSNAVVLILAGIGDQKEMGTGFFSDSDATLVTAAHVVFDVKDSIGSDGKVAIQLSPKANLQAYFSDGRIFPIQIKSITDQDKKNAGADLAVIKNSITATTP